jgi:hypothetical protein
MSRHAISSALRPITLQSVYDEIATVRELLAVAIANDVTAPMVDDRGSDGVSRR